MLYYKDWCTLNHFEDRIVINAHLAEKDIKNKSFSGIKKSSVDNAVSVVGTNPVICLSGGIDSQAAINIWKEQDFPFTAVTFDFGNNFNQKELFDAVSFADFLKIPIKVIKLDIMRFLLRDLYEFSQRYQMASPQFCVHAYFLETIRSLGYTGAVFGGNGFTIVDDVIKFQLTRVQLLDLENYSRISGFPVIPSFLSFDRDLCLDLLLSTDNINSNDTTIHEERYQNKIKCYKSLDLKIIPQESKKTGFEELKEYYNSINNSVWAFERDFRLPLLKNYPEKIIDTNLNLLI
jgi:hypothetical protein